MLLRGTIITSILTLLSRVLGFARDLLVAKLLGASLFADVFFVAFRIPNLLRSFLAEGALTSAFTPVFASAQARNQLEAQATFRRVSGFLLLLSIPISVIGIAYAPSIIHTLAPGFADDKEKFELCVTLTQLMMPYIACVSLIAMINAALNTLHIFGASAWAQVTMNIVLIAGALCAIPYEPRTATIILATTVLLGGVVQIFAQFPACSRAKLPLTPSFRVLSRDVGEVVRLMVPATLGASIYQLTIFLSTILASTLPDGGVSWLFYADRIAQFPVGIFSVALASVLLPALAQASASDDTSRFTSNLANSVRFTSFVIIPMSAFLWSLALPITELLFERGAFTHDSSIQTSRALQALAVGLWATSCYSMIIRAFIARKDTITPSIIGLCSLISNLVVSLLLMGPIPDGKGITVSTLRLLQGWLYQFSPGHYTLGHVGLAIASSMAAIVSLALVLAAFSLRYEGFPWWSFARSTTHAALASLAMVTCIISLSALTLSAFSLVAVSTCAGSAIYVGCSLILRSTESREVVAKLRRRLAQA